MPHLVKHLREVELLRALDLKDSHSAAVEHQSRLSLPSEECLSDFFIVFSSDHVSDFLELVDIELLSKLPNS
jgi:hypothetical protein